jgi:hypothetical protein
MLRLYRLTAVAAAFTAVAPVVIRPMWKESGWISTCAGIGCTGMRALCTIYSVTSPDGSTFTNYCYLDP